MTCAEFDSRLDALLDGRCAAEQWREAEAHLAGCPTCRRLFDAVSGRADDSLDDEGHEALASAVLARTSGETCASARERLCNLVDGELAGFDRELVEGHLARCRDCSAVATALAEQARVLPSFAELMPRVSLVPGVLGATSQRPVEPSFAERAGAWLRRLSERPRFSLEVAYVMTVLLLVILGNPVDAFKEASVRVQPRVSAVAQAVSGPLARVREAGAEQIANVERALAPRFAEKENELGSSPADFKMLLDGWWQRFLAGPFESIAREVRAWAGRAASALLGSSGRAASEPAQPPAR